MADIEEQQRRLINALARIEALENRVLDLEQNRALTEADKVSFRQVVEQIRELSTIVKIHIATDDQRVQYIQTEIVDFKVAIFNIARLKLAIYGMAAFLAGLGIFNVWAVLT